jgi:DNA mismatch repair protein MutS
VVFLRTLQRGGVAHSFGIHVARMAGMPQKVLACANSLLKKLETQRAGVTPTDLAAAATDAVKMSVFQLDDPALAALHQSINQINLDALSPLEAFDTLRALKKMAETPA